ncbi:MAG TPA: methionine adenosyltransferase [Candidatus Bathyarchaeia archaeon]|nr:methionine adenosyltransferase [Candidatus Bathyarchaeia archaeon]
MNYSVFASESVCAGHPDKICDQISDAVLDAAYQQDSNSHTGIECLVTTDRVVVSGEVKTAAKIDYETIARKIVKDLGYDQPLYHFDYHTARVDILVHQQSPDISLGVDPGGAGDQGMMFGYACRETDELMPMPIMIAHALVEKMDELKSAELPYLRPDGKSEVVVSYDNGRPIAVEAVVLAVPHDPKIENKQAKNDLYHQAVIPVLERFHQKPVKPNKVVLNGTGKWEIGGPHSDMGETGRKIIVDSYGGMARVGGGCFSGKDVTKVDRSGAYGARYLAKNIVAAGLADRCEVQVAYVIGHREPIARAIETFGTAKESQRIIENYAWRLLDMSVAGIINGLNLRQPIYNKTARYGHFGHPEYPWEQIVSV